jgi:HEAT repeat protein
MLLAAPGCGQGPPSPTELAQQALQADTETDQELAAVKLAEMAGKNDLQPQLREEVKQQLRRVLGESQSPQVRAACIQGLASQWDYESMPALMDALDDPSDLVRGRARVAIERMMSVDLGSFGYKYDDPSAKRAAAIQRIRNDWEIKRDQPVFQNWMERLKKKRS